MDATTERKSRNSFPASFFEVVEEVSVGAAFDSRTTSLEVRAINTRPMSSYVGSEIFIKGKKGKRRGKVRRTF